MHYSCIQQMRKANLCHHKFIKLQKDEFLCHVCQTLCNIYIPVISDDKLADEAPIVNLDHLSQLSPSLVDEISQCWTKYGDISEDKMPQPIPTIDQVPRSMLDAYMEQGFMEQEAYEATILELDLVTEQLDVISRTHTVTGEELGRTSYELKEAVVSVVRKIYYDTNG